jgi:hypothetical protein
MRRLFVGLFATALLGAPMAAAQTCTRPADLSAFDVASLKSQLMVTALSCDAREKYNSFVMRFRTDLMVQEHALTAYFDRVFGRRGQQEHDDYITLLANTQSEAGVHDGSLFCERNAKLLDEVLALPPGASLTGYASSKGLVHPISLESCTVPPPGTQVAQTRSGQR